MLYKVSITFKIPAIHSAPCQVRLHPVKSITLIVGEFFTLLQITTWTENNSINKDATMSKKYYWFCRMAVAIFC